MLLNETKAVQLAESLRRSVMQFMRKLLNNDDTNSLFRRHRELEIQLSNLIKVEFPHFTQLHLFGDQDVGSGSAWADVNDNSIFLTKRLFIVPPFINGSINKLFVGRLVTTLVHELVHLEQQERQSFYKRGTENWHSSGALTKHKLSKWFNDDETAKYDFHSMTGTELQAIAHQMAVWFATDFVNEMELHSFSEISTDFSKPAFISTVIRDFRNSDMYKNLFRTKSGSDFSNDVGDERNAMKHFIKTFYKSLDEIYDGKETSYQDVEAENKGIKTRKLKIHKSNKVRYLNKLDNYVKDAYPSVQLFRRAMRRDDLQAVIDAMFDSGEKITMGDKFEFSFGDVPQITLPKNELQHKFNTIANQYTQSLDGNGEFNSVQARDEFVSMVVDGIKAVA